MAINEINHSSNASSGPYETPANEDMLIQQGMPLSNIELRD